MTASTLRCPACGAPASPDDATCGYCRASLTTIACPSCFAPLFAGSRHCPHCGARATREALDDYGDLSCPRCSGRFTPIAVGAVSLLECGGCGGAWMHPEPFEAVCAERETQAAVLARPLDAARAGTTDAERVRYLPCPECAKLMNRVNFARYSGVIMDVCKEHGTFFDRDELRRIVAFIREGGLEQSRALEREKLVLEQRRLARMQHDLALERSRAQPQVRASRGSGVVLGEVLFDLFGI